MPAPRDPSIDGVGEPRHTWDRREPRQCPPTAQPGEERNDSASAAFHASVRQDNVERLFQLGVVQDRDAGNLVALLIGNLPQPVPSVPVGESARPVTAEAAAAVIEDQRTVGHRTATAAEVFEANQEEENRAAGRWRGPASRAPSPVSRGTSRRRCPGSGAIRRRARAHARRLRVALPR